MRIAGKMLQTFSFFVIVFSLALSVSLSVHLALTFFPLIIFVAPVRSVSVSVCRLLRLMSLASYVSISPYVRACFCVCACLCLMAISLQMFSLSALLCQSTFKLVYLLSTFACSLLSAHTGKHTHELSVSY